MTNFFFQSHSSHLSVINLDDNAKKILFTKQQKMFLSVLKNTHWLHIHALCS